MTIELTRLPEDVEKGATGGPRFETSVVALSSGAEQRNATWEYPLTEWDISYGIQSKADFTAVRDKFMAVRGRHVAFLFKDWSDYEATDENIGLGTGTKRSFIFVKNYAFGSQTMTRRITRPIDATVVIKVDGVVVDEADYTTGVGGWIRFLPGLAPANGAVVTWSGEFDIPVRFQEDSFDVNMEWEEAGTIQSCPVREVRDPINAPPTSIEFANEVLDIDENTAVPVNLKVADVIINDDPFGVNELTLTGADAAYFVLGPVVDNAAELFLLAATVLDFETKSSYEVTVVCDDPLVGNTPDCTGDYTLEVNDVNEPPSLVVTVLANSFAFPVDTSPAIPVATLTIVDDALGTNVLSLSGADAAIFEIVGNQLRIIDGTVFDEGGPFDFTVTVELADASLPSPPQSTFVYNLTVGIVPGSAQYDTPGAGSFIVPPYNTLVIEQYGAGAGSPGENVAGTNGGDTTIASLELTAGGGICPALTMVDGSGNVVANTNGGAGGLWSGGDAADSINGNNGGTGYPNSPATPLMTPQPSPVVTQLYPIVQGYIGTGSGVGASAPGPAGGAGGVAVASFSIDMRNRLITTGIYTPTPASQTLAPGSGSAARAAVFRYNGAGNGAAPGGAGSGPLQVNFTYRQVFEGIIPICILSNGYSYSRPGGGSGAYNKKTYVRNVTEDFPAIGATLNFVNGAGGVGGVGFTTGGNGGNGRTKFTWS